MKIQQINKNILKEDKLIKVGQKIINFIESKHDIKYYYTEYWESLSILEIVFNYNFVISYDFNSNTLILIDHSNNKIDITEEFENYKFKTRKKKLKRILRND